MVKAKKAKWRIEENTREDLLDIVFENIVWV